MQFCLRKRVILVFYPRCKIEKFKTAEPSLRPLVSNQPQESTCIYLHIILLAGDICVNPGPNSNMRNVQNQPRQQHRKDFPINCLVVNARSLKSLHKLNGKQVCNRFQELVYSENADLVWVAETWLNKDIANMEILPTSYTLYRKDRASRAGGVLLAVKTNSYIPSPVKSSNRNYRH